MNAGAHSASGYSQTAQLQSSRGPGGNARASKSRSRQHRDGRHARCDRQGAQRRDRGGASSSRGWARFENLSVPSRYSMRQRPNATQIVFGSWSCRAALMSALVVACSGGQPAGEGQGIGGDGSAASGDSGSSSSDGSDDRPVLASDASSSTDAATVATPPYAGLRQSNVVIGNVFLSQPGAIAFVSNDEAGILMQVGWSGTPGTAAPDGSINKLRFTQDAANISFDWTRTGNAIAARLSTDTPITFALELIPSWPAFQTTYSGFRRRSLRYRGGSPGKRVPARARGGRGCLG